MKRTAECHLTACIFVARASLPTPPYNEGRHLQTRGVSSAKATALSCLGVGRPTLARGGWLDPLRARKDLHLARSIKLAWRTNGLAQRQRRDGEDSLALSRISGKARRSRAAEPLSAGAGVGHKSPTALPSSSGLTPPEIEYAVPFAGIRK